MSNNAVWGRVRAGDSYLAVFLMAVPIAVLANFLSEGSGVFKGQGWSVLVPFAFAAISFALWFLTPGSHTFPPITYVFLTFFILAWVALWLLEKRDGQGLNFTTFLVPILAVMLMIKPVSSRAVKIAAATFAWTMVGVFVFSLFSDLASGNSFTGLTFRTLGFSGSIGEGSGRWEGPFGSPNYAGPAAAYLILYAVTARGWPRRVLLLVGLCFLILTGSRSAILGTLVGLIVYFIFSDIERLDRLTRLTRLGISVLILVPFTVVAFLADRTLNGRTPIWPEFWQLWKASPITGVGTQLIQDRISIGEYPGSFVHAHNMALDLLGRYGTIGFIAVAVVVVCALFIVGPAASRAVPMGLALVSTFLVIGLVEVHGSWLYWSIPTVWLLIAVLDSSAVFTRERPMQSTSSIPNPQNSPMDAETSLTDG